MKKRKPVPKKVSKKKPILKKKVDEDKLARDKNVLSMRKASGEYQSDDLLVAFLYILMRDSVVPGKVEAMILELTNAHDIDKPVLDPYTFTNGWLAQYAAFVADRLKRNIRTLPDIENHKFSNRFNR